MPRKTRRQLVGKQEDVEQEEREEALRALERELHLVQKIKKFVPHIVERVEDDISQMQAKRMLLTVHS